MSARACLFAPFTITIWLRVGAETGVRSSKAKRMIRQAGMRPIRSGIESPGRDEMDQARLSPGYTGGAGRMHVQRLFSSEDRLFTELLRIYEEAIPESERKGANALAGMVERPEYQILLGVEGVSVAGFSIACALQGTDAALLEYMAVAAGYRGQGLGGRLFQETVSTAAMAGRHVLIEVDSDRMADEDAARRKRFYLAHGCRELEGLAYRMPKVGEAEPPPMELMLYCAAMPRSLEKARLRTWLEACDEQVYGVAAASGRVARMLERLGPVIPLVNPER